MQTFIRRLSRANALSVALLTLAVLIVVCLALLWDSARLSAMGVMTTSLGIQAAATRYQQLGIPLTRSANDLVSESDRDPMVSVAIFDQKGKLLAGDPTLNAEGQKAVALMKLIPPPPGMFHGFVASDVRTSTVKAIQQERTLPPHAVQHMTSARFVQDQGGGLHGFLQHHSQSLTRFPGGFAIIAANADFVSSGVWRIALLIALLGGLAMLGSWYATRAQAKQVLAPVASVTGALRRLAVGDFSRFTPTAEEEHAAGELYGAYNAAAATAAAAVDDRQRLEANMRQFVADAGHELRTPLTVIMGYVDVLHRGAIAEQALARRILDTMREEGERMRVLISKLLLLARLESVHTATEARVDLSVLARKVIESARPFANGSLLELHAPQPLFVIADETELREALFNIVDNALKYAPRGRIEASLDRQAGEAVLTVADSGPGIADDERPHAFERFFRGGNHRDIPGSGLGLAIAKRSVERAHGQIHLDSTPGKGTRVTIRLPIAG
ncbi:MAG: HAMP domain-containing histidine kinase [Candidatus Eremiobacteraeota bacterium]|nr:HAMP domain-containing histidine kinase [Candidatus Eremiobacteraeota bacterium]